MQKSIIYTKIIGCIPKHPKQSKGDAKSCKKWSDFVIEKTRNEAKVHGLCKMRVIFYCHSSQYPTDFPFGPDIDNLLKNFQDALNKTIFSDVPGHDSCVVEINAKKVKVFDEGEAGAELEIFGKK